MDITLTMSDYITTMSDYVHCGDMGSCLNCKASQHLCGHSYILPIFEKYPNISQDTRRTCNRTLTRQIDFELGQMMTDTELPSTITIENLYI